MLNRILPISAAVVVVGVGTLIQGIDSERWRKNRSEILLQFSERLNMIPAEFGNWESTEQTIDSAQFEKSGCVAHMSRLYQHRDSGDSISAFLVIGTSRHVTIHTPDWCYRGAGYEMEGGEFHPYVIPCGMGGEDPEFSTATFIKEESTGVQHLRIFWGYSDNGRWEGPQWPKPHYAMRPALFKLYLITPIAAGKRAPEHAPSLQFARDFIPLINEILFSPTAGTDAAAETPPTTS